MPWKIRRKRDGLFSTGGMGEHDSHFVWSKNGKSWSSLGALKNHLGLFARGHRYNGSYHTALPPRYDDAEIVEYRLVESSAVAVADFVERMNAERER